MAKNKLKSKDKSPEKKDEQIIEEIDFSEGFGGIPSDVSFTRNIGCASNAKKRDK